MNAIVVSNKGPYMAESSPWQATLRSICATLHVTNGTHGRLYKYGPEQESRSDESEASTLYRPAHTHSLHEEVTRMSLCSGITCGISIPAMHRSAHPLHGATHVDT
jgi:hypothetical protein